MCTKYVTAIVALLRKCFPITSFQVYIETVVIPPPVQTCKTVGGTVARLWEGPVNNGRVNPSIGAHCTPLHRILPRCTVLYCTALHALHCTTLHCMHRTAPYCMHGTALYVWHCTALNALYCTARHAPQAFVLYWDSITSNLCLAFCFGIG